VQACGTASQAADKHLNSQAEMFSRPCDAENISVFFENLRNALAPCVQVAIVAAMSDSLLIPDELSACQALIGELAQTITAQSEQVAQLEQTIQGQKLEIVSGRVKTGQ
jgi:septal ring factor EnvC (AmiA/AmiB activator)